MAEIVNIAAYKFAPLTELKQLRETLLASCRRGALKGTILLSVEGINLFIAGPPAEIERFLLELRRIQGLENLKAKASCSEHQPFNRMLVRIKKEIIAFGVEGIDPARHTSARLAPAVLKQWLDEGRPITLFDTRNDYEVKLGTFAGARTAGIDHFRQFPDAVRRLPVGMKEQPVVTFCTGGIRCEKAAPYLEREGFREVYQLDGGILNYFKECGGAHYEGECFVFDQRVGVDPALRETDSAQCFACLAPLSPEDQRSPRFDPPRCCPFCYRTPAEEMAQSIAIRQASIHRVTDPLPGSTAYENRRPLSIPASADGAVLLDALCGIFPHVERAEWARVCDAGQYVDHNGDSVSGNRRVRAGERYFRLTPASVEPDVNAAIRILHEDEAIVVVEKPAPLPMHPSGRYNRNTLQFILAEAYSPERLRPVHRLDSNTSGLVLFARTRHFAQVVQSQFALQQVSKTYLARVQGWPSSGAFSSDAPISAEPGRLGSREADFAEGRPASTRFDTILRLPDGTALLEVRPLTGRTNQIRVHLWELGLPICGDPAYLPERVLGGAMTLPVGAPPLCLHAWRLAFVHPLSKAGLAFESQRPAWANLQPAD